MKKEHIQKLMTAGILSLSFVAVPVTVNAQEIVITIEGNGGGSDSHVETTVSSSTTVEQNNEATINNDVSSDANTGGNSADFNTGENTTVQTGDASATTTVSNDNVNSNTVSGGGAHGTSVQTTISGNGAGSNNSSTTNSSTSNTINQTNNASITNNIVTNANTGRNSARANNGDVLIKTGNITANHTINNKNINVSVSSIKPGSCNATCIQNTIKTLIVGNGAHTDNFITINFNDKNTISSINWAEILNNSIMNLNTGGNMADLNNGDVAILTGDITANISINNEVNHNQAEIDCNCPKPVTPPDPEEPTEEPTTPPQEHRGGKSETHNSSGGSSPTQSILGTAIGNVLPATGNILTLWLTLASLIMFFAGWYLRFRSGCAPGAQTA